MSAFLGDTVKGIAIAEGGFMPSIMDRAQDAVGQPSCSAIRLTGCFQRGIWCPFHERVHHWWSLFHDLVWRPRDAISHDAVSCKPATVPAPDSLVFVSMNIWPGDQRNFQDTQSYCARGQDPGQAHRDQATVKESLPEGRVYLLHEEDLFQVQDCRGLAQEFLECMNRREDAGRSA
jgi:hypothetical protein